jgi:hypothetical protein
VPVLEQPDDLGRDAVDERLAQLNAPDPEVESVSDPLAGSLFIRLRERGKRRHRLFRIAAPIALRANNR